METTKRHNSKHEPSATSWTQTGEFLIGEPRLDLIVRIIFRHPNSTNSIRIAGSWRQRLDKLYQPPLIHPSTSDKGNQTSSPNKHPHTPTQCHEERPPAPTAQNKTAQPSNSS